MTTANQAQADAWNGDSGQRWVADADRRDAVLASVGAALLAAARLQAGEDVLDVGCGCGATTLAAAGLIAPGHATGIDLSAPMLDLARRRASGTSAVFVEADAQTHPFPADSYDVAIGRFGTMFFDDPVAAFANLGRAVRPGGRLCLATWQRLDANPWLLVPGATLLAYGQLPEAASSTGPGMFAQADAAAITEVLLAAGWTDVEVDAVAVPLRLGADGADATEYLADTGIARAVLDTIPEPDQARALADVRATLEAIATDAGVVLDAGINLVTAHRPLRP